MVQLFDLMTLVTPVDISLSGDDVRELFRKHSDLRLIPVTDGGMLAGVVERARFLGALSQRLGVDVYGRRPISLLMSPTPGVLQANSSLMEAARVLLDSDEREIPPALVVLSGGLVVGVVDTNRLMGAIVRQFEQQSGQLRQAQIEAETASKAKSAFLAAMSHELRTPLNGVLGMASALERTKLDSRQREMTAMIRDSGDVLMRLLDDVLDLARIDAGKMELSSVQTDVATLVRTAAGLFAERANDKGIGFELTIETGAGTSYLCDAPRLKQIVYNLVSNAIKFTQTGRVGVRLNCSGPELVIEVQDTGIGMSPETVERLFHPFTQADSSISRTYGGTGLGLSICRRIVDLIGGRISVQSKPGAGSRFTVTLPLERCDMPTQEAAPTPLDGTPQPLSTSGVAGGSLRVLAAEDNPTNRAVLSVLLAPFGVDLSFAINGAEAVTACEQTAFDLVLMDLQMPVMDGLEACRQIRQRERAYGQPRVPVIALSANALPSHVSEALDAGMDAHVAKPIQLPLLLAAIDDVFAATDALAGAVVA